MAPGVVDAFGSVHAPATAVAQAVRSSPKDRHDELGHRDPKHTVHYTRVAASRFEGLWR